MSEGGTALALLPLNNKLYSTDSCETKMVKLDTVPAVITFKHKYSMLIQMITKLLQNV